MQTRDPSPAPGEISQSGPNNQCADFLEYSANATGSDLAATARDPGLTDDEMAECGNPG
jgi:hypothetical protein